MIRAHFLIHSLFLPLLVWYPLAFIFFIIFSKAMALPMSPASFSLPVMKAFVGFSLPANMSMKSPSFRVKVTSAAPVVGSPDPTEPAPFFKSMKYVPASDPKIN